MPQTLATFQQNLFTNSEQLDTWTPTSIVVSPPVVTPNAVIAPDGTLTAESISQPAVPSGSQASYIHKTYATSSLVPFYCYSIWLKGSTGGEIVYLQATADGVNYTGTTRCLLTTEWKRYWMFGRFTTANIYFLLGTDRRDSQAGATTAQTYYAWGVALSETNYPAGYVKTEATPYNVVRPMLMAPTQQNLLRYSNDTSNVTYWSTTNVSYASRTSPDYTGALRANKLVDSVTAAPHYTTSTVNTITTFGKSYTLSYKVKAAELNACFIYISDGVNKVYTTKFNLATGVDSSTISFVFDAAPVTYGIRRVDNTDWYEVYMSVQLEDGKKVASCGIGCLGSYAQTSTAYTGTGSQGIYFCDANLCEGIILPPAYVETTVNPYNFGSLRLSATSLPLAPTRQNLVRFSNDTTNPVWSFLQGSIASRNNPDYLGNLRANRFVDNTTSSAHYAFLQNPTFIAKASNVYTVSCNVKADQLYACYLRFTDGVNPNIFNKFDLSNGNNGGPIVNGGALATGIKPIGTNGWYRIWMTVRVNAGNKPAGFLLGTLDTIANTTATYAGTGGGILFSDFNINEGYAVPDSYETTSTIYDIGNLMQPA